MGFISASSHFTFTYDEFIIDRIFIQYYAFEDTAEHRRDLAMIDVESKRVRWAFIFSILLGILFKMLFTEFMLGVSYPLYLTAMYLIFLYFFQPDVAWQSSFGWFLSIPMFLLSLMFAIYEQPAFRLINFLLIPCLWILHTLLITNRRLEKTGLLDNLFFIIDLLLLRYLCSIGTPFKLCTAWLKQQGNPQTLGQLGKVVIGLLISIPIFLIVVPLLTSADSLFRQFIITMPTWSGLLSISGWFINIVVVLVSGIGFFVYLVALATQQKEQLVEPIALPQESSHDQSKIGYLDFTVGVTILLVCNVLYVVFVGFQVSYLFMGANGLPDGVSYAEYAQNGFYELVKVSFFNLLLLLLSLHFIKGDTLLKKRIINLLLTVLTISTLFMLYSAHVRLQLYEEAYGFTFQRIIARLAMGCLLIACGVTLYQIWKRTLPLIKVFIMIGLCAYTLINVINIEHWIVKLNIERYQAIKKIDYLTTLSLDAIPTLAAYAESEPELREKVSRILANYRVDDESNKHTSWSSFVWSRYRANQILHEYVENEL
ncbi:DUF4173 domain-containing protein [Brevibacillus sp. VP]|nr:DUF4173 domain-containing protein [Brevibacillus sp. VP]